MNHRPLNVAKRFEFTGMWEIEQTNNIWDDNKSYVNCHLFKKLRSNANRSLFALQVQVVNQNLSTAYETK